MPIGNVIPDGIEHTGATAPSTRSVAFAAKVTGAPAGEVASTDIVAGTLSAGGVVSVTETVNDA